MFQDLFLVVGRLSGMLLIGFLAFTLLQAFFVAYVIEGFKMARKGEVIEAGDFFGTLKRQSTLAGWMLKHKAGIVASCVTLFAMVALGVQHPGMYGWAVPIAFLLAGPGLSRVRRATASALASFVISRAQHKTAV